jgi:hypothetical protein
MLTVSLPTGCPVPCPFRQRQVLDVFPFFYVTVMATVPIWSAMDPVERSVDSE